MEDAIQTQEHNGHVIEIHYDENPESPRNWDNLTSLVTFHKHYDFGNDTDYKTRDFDSWAECRKQIIKDFQPVAIKPLYLFDHGGQTIATDPSNFQACDPQGWDWGQIGFVFVQHDIALHEFSQEHVSQKLRDKCMENLEAEMDTYAKYIRGEMYGYILKKDGEEINSCWGYFSEEEAIESAKKCIPEEINA